MTVVVDCAQFMAPARVGEAMETFVTALWDVLTRSDVGGESKAAWAILNLTAIHPFSDGNGRLARLLMNWVLRTSLSLPFVLTLCASESQRKEVR
jgi:Fic family protein